VRIGIISVGKLKERYWVQAVDEYSKRLSRFCRLEYVEVADEAVPPKAGPHEIDLALSREGERIQKHIHPGDVLITMEINGREMDSVDFAKKIDSYALAGKSSLTFVIGGSHGLHPDITRQSDWHLSFSRMTFPHQLFRVLLLEQIYRAFKINHNETYHK